MTLISSSDVRACMHPRLPPRYVVAIACAALLSPVLAALALFSTVTMILPWVVFLIWLSLEILYARFVGASILVSELNYPRIDALAKEVKAALGVSRDFSVFVYEQGAFNAFMRRMFFRRAIFINSEILESGVSDDEVRWIVGRFIGYWRVQQDAGAVGWLIRRTEQFLIFNLFILPYERAMVYTGDRLGLQAIDGDIGAAVSAMQKLLVGRLLGYSVNPIGVIEQSRRVKGSLIAFLGRIGAYQPPIITRYVDLIVFAKRRFPEAYARFEAANPGIPDDIDALSGEKTTGESVQKGALAAGGVFVGLVVTLIVWGAVLGVARRGRSYTPPSDFNFTSNTSNSSSTNGAGDTASNTTAANASGNETGAASTSTLDDPVILSGVSSAEVEAAYPPLARAAGVSGKVSVACVVTWSGGMSDCGVLEESPSGYGFGAAAVTLASRVRVSLRGKDGSSSVGRRVVWSLPFTASR